MFVASEKVVSFLSGPFRVALPLLQKVNLIPTSHSEITSRMKFPAFEGKYFFRKYEREIKMLVRNLREHVFQSP
jgi:hypothetical protein